MPAELHLLGGIIVGTCLAYAGTPLAIRVADRFAFYDHPVGYKSHGRSTPYLGGAAVVGAFVIALALVAGHPDRTLPVVGGVLVLWVVGTVDDRRNLSPWARLAVEAAVAAGVWALNQGWNLGAGWGVDLAVTVVWVLAVINAFNLFDNMDGAAGTMAAVSAIGVGVLGILIGDLWLMAAAGALCGACVGFLPHNLARPAKIFLGDGGSMPVGFAVGALIMTGSAQAATEWQALAMGLLFVGIPAVDTCLVMVSRRRRGVAVLSGGRDHLTHRAHVRLRTARAVAVSLGGAQALLSVLALMTVGNGSGALVAAVVLYLIAAAALIAALDANYAHAASGALVAEAPLRTRVLAAPALAGAAALLGLAASLSAFAHGLYESARWAPAGLGLLVVAVAVMIARPLRWTRPLLLAVLGLGALSLWALASSLWGVSAHSAVLGGNRFLVLTTTLVVGALLLRSRRGIQAALAGVVAGAGLVAAWQLYAFAFGDGHRVITAGRLDGPLGYINGLGSFYVMAAFAALAIAERAHRRWVGALSAAAISPFAGLVVLTQSRGAALAAVAASVAAIAVAPGRLRRLALLVAGLAPTVLASHWLLAVYREGQSRRLVPVDTLHGAAIALAAGAVAAGAVWVGLLTAERRLDRGWHRRAERAWTAGTALAGALAVAFVLIHAGAVADRVSTQFDMFAQGRAVNAETPAPETRLTTEDSNRYEYWRIAWRAFEDKPVGGVGAGGYTVPYHQLRTAQEDVTQPHSIVMQTLSELGAVGALLLLAFLGAAAWGILRCARAARRRAADAPMVAGLAGIVVAWVAHVSVDWIHLLPGLTAIALLAIAACTGPALAPPRRRAMPHWSGPARLGGAALASLLVTLAAVSLSRQTLAEHFRAQAQHAVRSDPAQALHEAELSLRVDRTDTASLAVKAAALSRLGREAEAGQVLQLSLRHEPRNFVTMLLLGDHETRSGRPAAARVWYRRALALNPQDPTLRALAGRPS